MSSATQIRTEGQVLDIYSNKSDAWLVKQARAGDMRALVELNVRVMIDMQEDTPWVDVQVAMQYVLDTCRKRVDEFLVG